MRQSGKKNASNIVFDAFLLTTDLFFTPTAIEK